MSDELDEAIRKLETKHRIESFLVKIGANEEAAKLIASSPEQLKAFNWDGMNLTMRGSDLAASEDQQAIDHFVKGPFKALFVKPDDKTKEEPPQVDPALVEAAKTSLTAKGQLLRALNGNERALEAALADKTPANAHINNPFSRAGWSISKQGSVYKALGETKCAALAAAVGAKIGGTSWNPNHPANQ